MPSWGEQGPDATRLAHAESLLQRAEREPGQARVLTRQAAAEVPPGTCPHLAQAANNPTKSVLAQARNEVTALRRATTLQPAGSTTSAQAHSALREVLGRGEFQEIKRSKMPKPVQQFFRWMHDQGKVLATSLGRFFRAIGRWLARLIPHFKAPSVDMSWMNSLGTGVRYLLYALVILALLLLLGLIVSRVMAGWQHRIAPEGPAATAATRRRQEPTRWERSLQEVEDLWQHGEQREAIRLLYRACLVLLDTRGVLRLDETRANGEVLRELRRQGRTAVQESLRPIVRGFDQSWYGYLPVTHDEFTGLLEHSRQFRDTVVGES
jgi:hypothetical protein